MFNFIDPKLLDFMDPEDTEEFVTYLSRVRELKLFYENNLSAFKKYRIPEPVIWLPVSFLGINHARVSLTGVVQT